MTADDAILRTKTLLVVFHSMTGGAQQMAHAVARGAEGHRVDVCLMRAPEAQAVDVIAADAYIFVTPENLAAISGVMKDLPRPRVRSLGTRSARPVRKHAVSSRRRAPRPWMYSAW